ncbi:MAG TPA: AAA family ATPase, partial [Anaerolineales bacterium]|nr:AAA family ATPase [Anaerolineales bacterium]
MSGTLKAVTLFMDISGSTALTQTMLIHGKRGAEILSTNLNRLFEPVIHAVYTHDGFITGFAGDAFTAVFPWHNDEVPLKAVHAAEIIRQTISSQSNQHTPLGAFPLEGRVGMSVGEVEWGIVGPGARLAYFFRGVAIEGCGKAEGKASGGQVVVDGRLSMILYKQGVRLIPIGEGYSCLEENVPGRDVPTPSRGRKSVPQTPNQLVRIAARFFPPRLLETPLPGEFRNAAIVFIQFESHLEFKVLNEFVSRSIWAADRLDGHFSEIDFGDKGGVLLFYFGAPIAHENDAKRALNFVLNFRERLSEEGLAHIKWRSGITFGPVYSGLTGTPYRGKYSLLGLTVNFAARLMNQADWGQVFVSEIVSQELEFLFRPVGDFAYKGFTHPVPTYQLLGTRPVYEKIFKLPMVGREAELQQLLDAAKSIFEGYFAGVAIVYGEPGMGKSRLTHALRQALPKRVTWMTAQNDRVLRQPFSPFVHLLKQYFRQLPDATHFSNLAAFELQLEQLANQLLELGQNGKRMVGGPSLSLLGTTILQKKSLLGALVGLRWTDSLYEQLDGQGRSQNSLLAIKSLILAESRLRPVVLELEDAHRLDEASQEMLNFLTYHTSSYPIFILITTRYEEDGSLPSFKVAPGTPILQIELEELPSDIIRRLAKDILDDSVDDDLLEVLVEKTRGNPYFAEQILYYFQENGLLQRLKRADKFLWAVQNLPHHDLPASIQAILTAQIDRLSPQLREAVMAASVLGREFNIHVLSYILG